MLESLDLLPVYDSADHDLIKDLFIPLLSHSEKYYRGVGFFTSGWLRLASKGIVDLIENGGSAKFVISPYLEKPDWEALQLGDEARRNESLKQILKKNVQDLSTGLAKDTLNTLAWMVADNVLDFKFAIPRENESGGDYHDKVGVFMDSSGHIVAIHGSFNDTVKGSLNGEAFSVFKSWEEGQRPYIKMHKQRLTALWAGGNNQFHVYTIPQAARDDFIKLRTSASRPYSLTSKEIIGIGKSTKDPQIPFELYPFQQDAVDEWVRKGCRGIFEMATGTGKTITSLAAAATCFNALGRVALVILVPYLHLLDQWREICEACGFLPILCSGEHHRWSQVVISKIQDFNVGGISNICILAVHDTAATERFGKATNRLQSEFTMLIGDEMHSLGAPSLKRALMPQATMRLGLSATPRRWFDESGTEILFSYFGDTCFEFHLSDAIGKYLTPYKYYPVLVGLSAGEMQEYEALTQQISVLASQKDIDVSIEEDLKILLIKRAQLVASSAQKIPSLLNIIRDKLAASKKNNEELRDVLVYCAPGTHKEVLRAVSNLGLRCHEFVHTVSISDRQKVLNQFAKGEIQALIAIKCLDEGVDVPSTKTAFFLASTTNPREFIQRRGRVLRLSPGKLYSELYDFIVMPDPPSEFHKSEIGRSLLRREMPRFAEFSSSAQNEFEARAIVRDILDQYEMLHLLERRPWEIYHDIMSARETRDYFI